MVYHRRFLPWRLRYGFAVGSVALATGGLGSIGALAPCPPFLLFVVAIAFSSAFGGIGPGFLSLLLSALATDYWFIPPTRTLTMDGASLRLAGFYALAATMSYLLASYRADSATTSPSKSD